MCAEGGKGEGVVAAESAAAAVAVAARMCIPFCIPVPDWPHFPESDHKYTIKNVTKYLTCVLSLYTVLLRYHSISSTFCVISVTFPR